jgi:polar amino acid transport system substrate-binding protein
LLLGLAALGVAHVASVGTASAACDLKAQFPAFVGKTLRVGTTADSPPYNYRDDKDLDKITGLNADYMRAVGACLGMPVAFAISDFAGLASGVQAGHIDLAVSTIQYRPERTSSINFVVYMKGAAGVVVRKDSTLKITKIEDVCGLKGAAAVGGAQLALLEELNKGACAGKPIAITATPGGPGGPMLVQTKRVDFYLGPATIQSFDMTLFKIAYTHPTELMLGAIFAKSSDQLMEAFTAAMRVLQSDGTEVELYKKYLMDPAVSLPVEIRKS